MRKRVVHVLCGSVEVVPEGLTAEHEAAVDEAQAGFVAREAKLGYRLRSASEGVELTPCLAIVCGDMWWCV